MKIKILKDTVAGGKRVQAGEVIEACDKDARILIGMSKAVLFVEPVVAPEESEAPCEEHEHEIAEAAPKKKKKGGKHAS